MTNTAKAKIYIDGELVIVDIDYSFEPDDPDTGWKGGYEIEKVSHGGIEITDYDEDELVKICEADRLGSITDKAIEKAEYNRELNWD